MVVDDARHCRAAAEIDDAPAGGGPWNRTANRREAAIANRHGGHHGIVRIHRVDAAVHEYEFLWRRALRLRTRRRLRLANRLRPEGDTDSRRHPRDEQLPSCQLVLTVTHRRTALFLVDTRNLSQS